MKVLLNFIVLYVALSCKFIMSVGDNDKKKTVSEPESETVSNTETIEQSIETQGATGGVTEVKFIKIDIKSDKETNDHIVYEKSGAVGTIYVRPGYGIRKVKCSDLVIWSAKKKLLSGESKYYAIRVDVDGLGSKNKLITIYLANGQKEIFSKSTKSERQQSGSSPESDKSGDKASCLRRRESRRKYSFKGRSTKDNQKNVDKESEGEKASLKSEEDSTPSEGSGDTGSYSASDVTEKSQGSEDGQESMKSEEASGTEDLPVVKRSESFKKSNEIPHSEQPEDVIIITKKTNEDGSDDEELIENDPQGYMVKKKEEYYEYELKDNYKLIEVKCKGETVWKHSDDPNGPFPESIIYKQEGNFFTINFKKKFELYARMTGGEWYRQVYDMGEKE